MYRRLTYLAMMGAMWLFPTTLIAGEQEEAAGGPARTFTETETLAFIHPAPLEVWASETDEDRSGNSSSLEQQDGHDLSQTEVDDTRDLYTRDLYVDTGEGWYGLSWLKTESLPRDDTHALEELLGQGSSLRPDALGLSKLDLSGLLSEFDRG